MISRLCFSAESAGLQDITYVPTQERWRYLALVLDLWSRKIVGWAPASQRAGYKSPVTFETQSMNN